MMGEKALLLPPVESSTRMLVTMFGQCERDLGPSLLGNGTLGARTGGTPNWAHIGQETS